MMFEILVDELTQLDPTRSVELLHKMLWTDASISEIPSTNINIPSEINDSDGGIDAEVVNADRNSKYGLIKKGTTYYQVKSGKNLIIKEILFNSKGKLKPKIKMCFDNNNTLILILTGYDKPETHNNELLKKFYDALQNVSITDTKPNIEIWKKNTIVSFLNHFPSLIVDIKNIKSNFITHETWSKNNDFRQEFIKDEKQIVYMNNIQDQLRNWSQSTNIRVIEEPGAGKTRIILETTRSDDIAPLVLYFETPDDLDYNDFSRSIKHDTNKHMILVVDECDDMAYERISNQFRQHGSRIKLITIHNEFNEDYSNNKFSPPLLSNKQIESILEKYHIPKEHISKWARECGDSPRAAHIIGFNLEKYPQDILKNPNSVPFWERYVANKNDVKSPEAKIRWKVLMWISLFKRFGYRDVYSQHIKYIAKLAKTYDNISLGDFNENVDTLMHMKVLQGKIILYITPKILHVKLWVKLWEKFGNAVAIDLDNLILKNENNEIDSTTHIFITWYFDMFRYAKKNLVAQSRVKKLLAEGGLFEKYMNTDKNTIIQNFFLVIAVIHPNDSLSFLERFFSKMSHEKLLNYKTGRTEIVFALNKIVMKKEYFSQAMKLLLTLAETENSTYANNATGSFMGLFSIVYGHNTAPTELAPIERFKILQEEFANSSTTRRIIMINACGAGLHEPLGIVNVHEYGELDDNVKVWIPANGNEIDDYRIAILIFMRSLLPKCNNDVRSEIVKVVFTSARNMLVNSKTVLIFFSILRSLNANNYANKESLVDSISKELKYNDHISKDMKLKLKNLLNNDIIGVDYVSKLHRYVGMDLLVDKIDENHDSLFKKRFCKLIDDSKNYELIKNELPWLIGKNAKNGQYFGYELGNHDKKFQLLPNILQSYRNVQYDPKLNTCHFLGGYMRVLYENNIKMYDQTLDLIFSDSVLYKLIPELIWRSGINDKSAKMLLLILDKPSMDYTIFEYFQYGRFGKLSDSIFVKWLEKIIKSNTRDSVILAINLLDKQLDYNFNWNLISDDLIFNLLTSEHISDTYHDVMLEYYWKNIADKFIKVYPSMLMPLAKHIFDNFSGNSIFSAIGNTQCLEILNDIISKHPSKVWELVSSYLDPRTKHTVTMTLWMRGDGHDKKSIFDKFPIDDVMSWIDESPNKRAPIIANLIPHDFNIARKILAKYSKIENVGRYIIINFNNESWTGSGATHHENKKQKLEELYKKESNINVQKWLSEYIQDTERAIDRFRGFDEELNP